MIHKWSPVKTVTVIASLVAAVIILGTLAIATLFIKTKDNTKNNSINASKIEQLENLIKSNLPINGVDGKDGVNGKDGVSPAQPSDGKDGKDGANGSDGSNGSDGGNGANGVDGRSNYDLWIGQGNVGTITDYLNSLKGKDGRTPRPDKENVFIDGKLFERYPGDDDWLVVEGQ